MQNNLPVEATVHFHGIECVPHHGSLEFQFSLIAGKRILHGQTEPPGFHNRPLNRDNPLHTDGLRLSMELIGLFEISKALAPESDALGIMATPEVWLRMGFMAQS